MYESERERYFHSTARERERGARLTELNVGRFFLFLGYSEVRLLLIGGEVVKER